MTGRDGFCIGLLQSVERLHSVECPGMSIAAAEVLVPLLTPHGHLRLVPDSDAPPLPAALTQRLRDAFARGSGHGLLHLGAAEVGSILPPSWALVA